MRSPKPWYRKSNRTWYVQIDGKQVPLGADKAAAIDEFHKLMLKRGQGVPLGIKTVRDVLDAYWNWYKTTMAAETVAHRTPVLKSFGKSVPTTLKVSALRGYHVQRWLDAEYPKTNSTTRNTLISIIKAAMNWAVEQGYVDINPIAGLKKPQAKIRQEFVPANVWQDVLDLATDQEFKDFLTVMLACGCRATEMFKFDDTHFDGNKLVLPIIDSKGKKRSRVVYLPDEALAIVKRLAARPGKLFRNRRGKPWNRNSIRLRFRRLKKELKMPKLCATTLRHSYAHYRLTVVKQDPLTVAKLMGHVDTRMISQRYGHVDKNEDYMRNAANQKAMPAPVPVDPRAPSSLPNQTA
jgi:integrase